MILTTTLINTTILKAYCSLAAKSIKYYTALALGKNNTCLFKEIRLLKAYIDVLKNFKIVGSKISCCCEIEGDYDTLLNNLSNATESPIQFNCDYTGYMIFNGQPYTFTYSYDKAHQVLMIEFNIVNTIFSSYFGVVDSGLTEYYAIKLNDIIIYSNTLIIDVIISRKAIARTQRTNNGWSPRIKRALSKTSISSLRSISSP